MYHFFILLMVTHENSADFCFGIKQHQLDAFINHQDDLILTFGK